jgi:hypothetical protein
MRRVGEAAVWMAATGAFAGALYWAFLNTPESSTSMLALSVVLLVGLFLSVAVSVGAVVLRVLGTGRREALATGAARVHWFILTAASAALLIWGVLRLDAWVSLHQGEITAWFIATFDWSDVSPLFTAERYASVWLRWVVIPSGMIAALASVLRAGGQALVAARWVRAAWRWQTLVVTTSAFALLVALPWNLSTRRPPLPVPLSLEAWAAGGRLLLIGALMALGAAIMLDAAARATADGRS